MMPIVIKSSMLDHVPSLKRYYYYFILQMMRFPFALLVCLCVCACTRARVCVCVYQIGNRIRTLVNTLTYINTEGTHKCPRAVTRGKTSVNDRTPSR